MNAGSADLPLPPLPKQSLRQVFLCTRSYPTRIHALWMEMRAQDLASTFQEVARAEEDRLPHLCLAEVGEPRYNELPWVKAWLTEIPEQGEGKTLPSWAQALWAQYEKLHSERHGAVLVGANTPTPPLAHPVRFAYYPGSHDDTGLRPLAHAVEDEEVGLGRFLAVRDFLRAYLYSLEREQWSEAFEWAAGVWPYALEEVSRGLEPPLEWKGPAIGLDALSTSTKALLAASPDPEVRLAIIRSLGSGSAQGPRFVPRPRRSGR